MSKQSAADKAPPTAFKKARDEWFQSEEGIRCTGVNSLRRAAPGPQLRVYLENRLDAAFAAGWRAAQGQS